MGAVILVVLLMNGWGDGIPVPEPTPTPEAPKRAVWDFRGSRDDKIREAMNARLAAAQLAYDEDGPALAELFGVKHQPDFIPFFYEADNDVTARAIAKKHGGGSFAFTAPGSRAIRLPGRSMYNNDPQEAQNIILHEVMHSLGLGEDRGVADSDRITRTIMDYYKKKKKSK